MTVANVVESWDSINDFIFDIVSGKTKTQLTTNDCEEIEKAVVKLAHEIDSNNAVEKAKRFMNLNILDKNVNFKVFDKLPNTWGVINVASMIASESVEA